MKSKIDEIEEIKEDLKHQLKFEHMNWDYFIDTAKRALDIAESIKVNFTE
jgi:hypothetical protein